MLIPALALAALLLTTSISPDWTAHGPADDSRARILLSHFDRTVVRFALDLAEAKLDRPACHDIYADFVLPRGGTPQRVLDSMKLEPRSLLEHLVFLDGSRDRACAAGLAGLTTSPGSFVIHVCPHFIQLYARDPSRSAILILHESLHVLGLGEGPPSSSTITRDVEGRCWQTPQPRSRSPEAPHGVYARH